MYEDQDYKINDFLPPWLQNYLESLPSTERERFLAEFDSGVQNLLKSLESLPLNRTSDGTERGQCSVMLPGTTIHINLKTSLWTLAKYGGPLLLASSLAAPLVAALGITLASPHILSTVGSAIAALYQAVAKLNATEMDTYLAVAATIEHNKNQRFEPVGASLPQILDSFDRDKKNLAQPINLKAMLNSLVEDKKVLIRKANTGLERYYLAF